MENQLYTQVEVNALNEQIISDISSYIDSKPDKQIYIINSPLGDKYNYENQSDYLVILIPKHKLIFIDLVNSESNFVNFYEDFIEDLSSISDKYKYKEHIGRPRNWKEKNTIKIVQYENIEHLIEISKINNKNDERISDLLISLLIGSINDIERVGTTVPETILDKVKKNIILFDGDQTRFIYQEFINKVVTIQGLSGTGKTELLLHKLKDLYINEEKTKIFFTCHNIALANTLKSRIPEFFDFMKVEKQIEWNKRLWVDRAWGSGNDKNSGLYSYICDFYNIPFLRYSPITNYEKIFSLALEHVNSIDNQKFEYCFDYILIDERQDFPEVFFQLCEKVTKNKVFVAGDIFQDIFESSNKRTLDVDVMLNKCYRTDPRTLMFAHGVGLGLFEETKLNWFNDKEWESLGYYINRIEQNKELHLSRKPIRRFEDIDIDEFISMEIINSTNVNTVIDTIKEIKSSSPEVTPDDIAIIVLDSDKIIYRYIDNLVQKIYNEFQWEINRAYENKSKIKNQLFITNPNNVKGLEFPFVVCITGTIEDSYKYRNILYTMLTRSFIKSYLLVHDNNEIEHLKEGLKIINTQKYIKTIEPSDKEKEEINNQLIKFLTTPQISYDEFLEQIFDELKVDSKKRKKIKTAINSSSIQEFDREITIKYIKNNIEFY